MSGEEASDKKINHCVLSIYRIMCRDVAGNPARMYMDKNIICIEYTSVCKTYKRTIRYRINKYKGTLRLVDFKTERIV